MISYDIIIIRLKKLSILKKDKNVEITEGDREIRRKNIRENVSTINKRK